jgi:hypothetical protein
MYIVTIFSNDNQISKDVMKNENIKNIIKEIVDKSKDCKDGIIAPEKCRIKISELENYDFILVSELGKIKKVLSSIEGNYFYTKETIMEPILKIDGDYITFYKNIIKEFQKEVNQ